jgi:hypothetical protein
MPQASDEDRDLMGRWFGNRVDLSGPLEFLTMRGWVVDKGGRLKPPVPAYRPSQYEMACIGFLICEWDYGYGGEEGASQSPA